MRHCEKSRSFVCQSVIAMDIVAMHVWMSISWVLNYSLAKAGRTNRGAKEAETSSESSRERRANSIDVVRSGRVS
jgi:hypothetical protein